jgi:hypothetical protein
MKKADRDARIQEINRQLAELISAETEQINAPLNPVNKMESPDELKRQSGRRKIERQRLQDELRQLSAEKTTD